MQKSRLFMYFERFSFRKNTKLRCFDVSSPGQWSDLAFTMAMLFPLALWILKLPRTPPAADPAGKPTKKTADPAAWFPVLALGLLENILGSIIPYNHQPTGVAPAFDEEPSRKGSGHSKATSVPHQPHTKGGSIWQPTRWWPKSGQRHHAVG